MKKFQHNLIIISYKVNLYIKLGFPGGSLVANLLAMQDMQETWVQSLGPEDPLEKEMANHSSTPAWEIPWTEEPGRLQFMGSQTQEVQFMGSNMTSN